ncbi:NlpC/P60 family protein [Kiritimatiellota bacterium B12222]|nr:NlpC/P60 family protein [Kiritimatiellota bacterium B12222]
MKSITRRIPILIFILCGVGMCGLVREPVHRTIYHLLWIGLLLGAWGSAFLVLKNWRWGKVAWGICTGLVLLPFCLPGRAIDVEKLRENTVAKMISYEGVRYSWGGENARGIDCSGLPRRAYRDALLGYGFRYANGRACRAFLEQWWFDASAKALGEGYRGYTVPLLMTGEIRSLDDATLLPGDLAVTTNGLHVLTYLGEGKWIQAEPGLKKVVILHGKQDHNIWFSDQVSLHRWTMLTETD